MKRLGDLGSVAAGGTPSRAVAGYWDGDIPWVTTSEIDFNFIESSEQFITKDGLDSSAAKLFPPGTLLMALYGQGKTRGKVGILGIEAATNQACAAISLGPKAVCHFVFHFLVGQYSAIRKLSNMGNQENLNGSLVRSISILLPPKPEQEAIAEALSDADALIESLEQLLAKKHQLKQGAMQELLTGRRRLPRFNEEWREEFLGDLGWTYGGLAGKSKRDFGHGSGRYITFMNIMANVVIDVEAFESVYVKPGEPQNRVAKGDLFFNGSSETPEEVGMCSFLTEDVQDVYSNSFCFGFRFRDLAPADGLYLAYYFRSPPGRELLKALAQGAIRYNLSKVALLKTMIPLPPLAEQAAIAAVLSDMDVEIAALEAKLAKACQIKRGMMQELLTGRIRLV